MGNSVPLRAQLSQQLVFRQPFAGWLAKQVANAFCAPAAGYHRNSASTVRMEPVQSSLLITAAHELHNRQRYVTTANSLCRLENVPVMATCPNDEFHSVAPSYGDSYHLSCDVRAVNKATE